MLRREGWSFKCVLGSFEKLVRSRGRRKIWLWNLGPDYTRQAGPLCRKPGTLDKRNKNQLCDYMTTEPARLAGIPVLWCLDPGGNFPSNHPFRAARGLNQAKNGRTGNTLFMGIAFQAHVIRPLLWVVLSRSLHVKLWNCRFCGSCVREYDRIRFAREDVGLCLFYGSTVKECNLFTRSFCPIRF